MSSRLLRIAALTLDKALTRAAEMFELTRGRVPPGMLISAFYPRVATDLLSQIRENTILIAGTNGKTTTCQLLAGILRKAGHATLHTPSGSGTIDDVSATLIEAANIHGSLRADYGVFGIDDESLYEALNLMSPRVVVLNNLYRDGVETEGGPEAVTREWRQLINTLPHDRHLLINSDDPVLCGGFVRGVPPRVLYFGVEDERLRTTSREAELTRCYRCGTPLSYRLVAMSHLGDYRCGKCGWERPMPSIYAINVEVTATSSQFRIITPVGPLDVSLNLPGVHNVYNAVAAAAAAVSLGINAAMIRSGLEQAVAEYGRSEPVSINNRLARLMLINNPTALNEAIRTSLMDTPPRRYLFLVDDEVDAGGDAAWIWDTNLEVLAGQTDSVIVSGSGADHLVLRFKHAGVKVTEINPDADDAFHRTMAGMPQHGQLWVLATDAAMFDLRRELVELGVVEE